MLLKATKSPNIGLVFKGKTWIKITKEYYDLVIEKQKKLYSDKENDKTWEIKERERQKGRQEESLGMLLEVHERKEEKNKKHGRKKALRIKSSLLWH